jgi:hypothetical protein
MCLGHENFENSLRGESSPSHLAVSSMLKKFCLFKETDILENLNCGSPDLED